MAQLVVIDQVLVAQGNPKHPLTDQAPYGVLDQIGITVIGEAVGKPLDQPDLIIGGAEQHCPGFRSYLAAVKRGHHFATFDGCKAKQIRATLCLHRTPPGPEINPFSNSIFSDPGLRCTHPFEKSGLVSGRPSAGHRSPPSIDRSGQEPWGNAETPARPKPQSPSWAPCRQQQNAA